MTNGVESGAESGAESGLKSLGPRLQELVRHIQDDVHAAGKAAAKAALREAVLGTPVKTGRARANWQVGQGSAPDGTLEATDAEGLETIAKGDAVIDAAAPGERLVIAKHLDYVRRLNDGDASRAGAGFMEKAAMAARAVLREG